MSKHSGLTASPMSKSEQDYQAEDDHRTLSRAGEITSDAGRMSGVRKHQKKQTKALAKVGRMLGK